jgi:hypothetical protein
MKAIYLTVIVFCLSSSYAHAGFWDFLFGEEAPANVEAPAVAGASLLKDLGTQLGVSNSQAKGGMGALLQLVQSNLNPEQFSQLNQALPEVKGLLAAAPSVSKGSGTDALNGLLSQVGGLGESAASLNTLRSQFDSLGLDNKMIGEYGRIAMAYYKNQGGPAADLIEQGLGIMQQFTR